MTDIDIAFSPTSWKDLWKSAHARAFTVARVTAMDVLEDIRKAVDAAMESGELLEEFKKNLRPVLERKGWFAPEGEDITVTLPDGTVRKRLTGWRLSTVYRTNMSAAYHVGRYEQMQAVKKDRPHWQYMAVQDGSTRPPHAAQHGKVYPADHEYWSRWYPPNGFN